MLVLGVVTQSPTLPGWHAGGIGWILGAPLLAFMRPLLAAWLRGIDEHGGLAHGVGQDLERQWLRGGKPPAPALEQADFSALTDLYQAVEHVYAMRALPVDAKSSFLVGVTTAHPLAVVALSSLPLDVLGRFIIDLMF